MPEYQLSRKVSGFQSSRGNSGGNKGGGGGLRKGGRNSDNIYNFQGKFRTGYYQNLKGLIKEDLKAAIATRKKKGRKSSHTAITKEVSDTKRQLSELSSTLTEIKSSIAVLSGKPQGTSPSEVNSGQEAPVSGDAGNYVGGRASKRTKA